MGVCAHKLGPSGSKSQMYSQCLSKLQNSLFLCGPQEHQSYTVIFSSDSVSDGGGHREHLHFLKCCHPLDPLWTERHWMGCHVSLQRCSWLWRGLISVLVTARLNFYSNTFFIVHEFLQQYFLHVPWSWLPLRLAGMELLERYTHHSLKGEVLHPSSHFPSPQSKYIT